MNFAVKEVGMALKNTVFEFIYLFNFCFLKDMDKLEQGKPSQWRVTDRPMRSLLGKR